MNRSRDSDNLYGKCHISLNDNQLANSFFFSLSLGNLLVRLNRSIPKSECPLNYRDELYQHTTQHLGQTNDTFAYEYFKYF